jgi:EmrB/QacA subfamily drug resistance transporter
VGRAGVRADPRPGAVLVVVSAAAFLSSLDLFIVNVAFPDIRAGFGGADTATTSWVLTGYTVVFAAFLALAGRLGDRLGRRRVFLAGLAVFTVASAACAAAPTLPLLIAARAVQALGAALVMPTSLALLLAAYPPERRAAAVGTWASLGAVAAALGPPLGGLLVEASWRWVFLVNVPVGVVALVAGMRVLRESERERSGVPDVVGALALVVGVGALAFALVRAPDDGWTGVPVLAGAVLAVVGLGVAVARSRRHPVPALDLPVLKVPTIALASTAMLLFTTGFAAMLFVNVLFLTGPWGWSALRAGLALAPGPAVVVLVARYSGRLVGRFGIGATTAVGGLAFAAGPTWWIVAATARPDYLVGILPGQLLTGLGVALVLPALSGAVGAALPAAQWGSGSSMINSARQVGAVLGVALVVVALGDAAATPDLAAVRHGWALLVATALATAAVGAVLARHVRGPRASRPAVDGAEAASVPR